MRPGTTGQNGKTVPAAPTATPGSEFWIQPSIDRPHWNEVLAHIEKVDTRATRADHFDPDGWQLPEIAELCRQTEQGVARNYMSAIAHLRQRPRCTNEAESWNRRTAIILRVHSRREATRRCTTNDASFVGTCGSAFL